MKKNSRVTKTKKNNTNQTKEVGHANTVMDRLHNICGEYKVIPATEVDCKTMLLSNSFHLSLRSRMLPHASRYIT